MNTSNNESQVTNFIFEMRQLREVKRSGWQLLGIPNKESVAEHSLRAAQLGFFLAHMEGGVDPFRVASMLVFHDIGEARIGDIHKVANRYIPEKKEGEAVRDQVALLGGAGESIQQLWNEVEERSTAEGIIAKDADYLEAAFTAREFQVQGHTYAIDWIKNVEQALRTASAKDLLISLRTTDPHEWWQGLKRL